MRLPWVTLAAREINWSLITAYSILGTLQVLSRPRAHCPPPCTILRALRVGHGHRLSTSSRKRRPPSHAWCFLI